MPEHAELYLLLSMVVPVPWLERVPTYKEQQENLKDKDLSSIGFLGYPLLQTADVAIYDARVRAGRRGSGARTSSWRARSCAASTTSSATVLVEPQPLLTTFGRLPGLDGDKKMSKSLGNTIHLSDSADDGEEEGACGCTRIPKRVRADIPGTVEGNPVFIYHDAFNPNTRRSRRPEGALPRRQGRRRRGEDEAGRRRSTRISIRFASGARRCWRKPERPAGDPVRRLEARARASRAETMARVRDAMKISYMTRAS